MKKSDLKGLKLKFDYCECGCKGHLAIYGNKGFWIFQEMDERQKVTNVALRRGHAWRGERVDDYKTFKEAVNKANDLMRTEVWKMLKELGG